MNTWVLDYLTCKDIVEAAIANMQACSLLNVQRKRLYSLAEFAAAQQAHRTKVRAPHLEKDCGKQARRGAWL